ncbi:MAG: DegT/DnrJ/EryC1/StrS family aminotransferase [Alphaproteobacteria bacterium]
MKVPFLDLRPSSHDEKISLLRSIEIVIDHGKFILGPEVREFEFAISNYVDRKYAIGVSSGTDALILAMRALNIGIGDEVIVPCLCWVAVINAVIAVGAKPVFAEVLYDLNLSPKSIVQKISDRTKAVIAVHSSGRMCDIREISEICRLRNLFLIEDGSQSFGAKRDKVQCGSTGIVSCFSMNPMKILGGFGEAGVILTNEENIYKKILILRNQGMIDRDRCEIPSSNMRLDTIQAAILLNKLKNSEKKILDRRKLADYYNKRLRNYVFTPSDPDGGRHVYFVYTIQSENRNELEKYLFDQGIETRVRDKILLPKHNAFKHFSNEEYAASKLVADKMISLPFYETMSYSQIDYVCDRITNYFSFTANKK